MSSQQQPHKEYSSKKGIGFGAFGGFIAAVAFTGIILSMPIVFGFSVGTFLEAIGLFVAGQTANIDNSVVNIVLLGFLVILLKGIVVGIIFGIITSKLKRLHTSSKRKGVILGLIAGVIAYLVLFVPVICRPFPSSLVIALETYPESWLSTRGLSDYRTAAQPESSVYIYNTLAMGIITYLVYGFILEGIVTLGYLSITLT